MKNNKTSLSDLFVSFAKIGAMTFGGGYAMLPLLHKECIEKYGWTTEEELLNYFAIGQCTPGIIAVNVATFIGYKERKTIGGIVATLGVVFPSILIILLLASLIRTYQDNIYVIKAFIGIRLAVCALILKNIFNLMKKTLTSLLWIAVAMVSFLLQALLNVSSVVIVLTVIAVALLSYRIKKPQEVTQ